MPKVSVCIPVYNNLSQVKRLLASLKQQSFRDFEIRITDDSDDNEIEEWIKSLSGERIDYLHNPEKLGPIHNWNKALEGATGEYIKLFFSDDWLNGPDALQEFVTLLDENPDAVLAFSGSRETPEEGEAWERCASDRFIEGLRADYRNLFLGNEIGTPSAMICRNVGARFTPDSHWASDMFLYFDLLKKNPGFAYTKKPLVCVGLAADQYTHTFRDHDKRKLEDYLRMYRNYGLKESEACRNYLKDAFLLPYYQPPKLAEECGFDRKAYGSELIRYFIDHKIVDYIRRLTHVI